MVIFAGMALKLEKYWASIHVHPSILIIILSKRKILFYIKNTSYSSSTCTCILWWISLCYLDY